MQRTLRRGVVDKYLAVPLRYYHSKATGELLSHTDADVLGTTTVIKPLPFSIGVAALIVFALATGVLFGVLPARQASRLDPVQALAKR